MADYQPAVDRTLRFEDSTLSGKLTDDTGGLTRFGISERAHPEVYPEMAECSVPDALAIARQVLARYWCFNEVESQDVANKLFDMAVNLGLGTTIIMAQRCTGTLADGIWGPKTVYAINASPGLLQCLRKAQAQHYRDLAEFDPAKYGDYLKGWLVRADY